MHLIQDHEAIQPLAEIELGRSQFGPILLGFQIQVDGIQALANGQGKRRLASLARAE